VRESVEEEKERRNERSGERETETNLGDNNAIIVRDE
jgi:hypothetical protein